MVVGGGEEVHIVGVSLATFYAVQWACGCGRAGKTPARAVLLAWLSQVGAVLGGEKNIY